MSSNKEEKDIIDYIDDKSQHEDHTPFIPVQSHSGPDGWSTFFGGILLGVSGGALILISPWLGATFIAAGYGLTAYSLAGSQTRFSKSLRFGFTACALGAAIILAGGCFLPKTAMSAVKMTGTQAILLGTFSLPWVISFFRYALCRSRAA